MVSVGAKMKGTCLRKGIKVTVLSKGDVTSAYTTTPIPKGEEVMFELPQGYSLRRWRRLRATRWSASA